MSDSDMQASARILAGLREDVERLKTTDRAGDDRAHEAHRVADTAVATDAVTIIEDVDGAAGYATAYGRSYGEAYVPTALRTRSGDADHAEAFIPVSQAVAAAGADTDAAAVADAADRALRRLRALQPTGVDADTAGVSIRNLQPTTGTDFDIATATVSGARTVTATGAETDIAAGPLARARPVAPVGADTDAASVTTGTVEHVEASGADGDTATTTIPVETIDPGVVDTFEAELYDDQGKTLADYYSGDVSNFARQTNTAGDGSYLLRGEPPDLVTNIRLISTSGLNAYPEAGDTFSCLAASSSNNVHVLFGVQDSNSFYTATLNAGQDAYGMYIYEGGDSTLLASGSASVAANTLYEMEVDWGTDGTLTLTVKDTDGNELDSTSATDTTWSSGGVGFYVHRTVAAGYFDTFQIK